MKEPCRGNVKIFITKRARLLKFTSPVQFCRSRNPLFAKLLYLFDYKLSDFTQINAKVQ